MTLKLRTYAPTGAPVAAATMGLPEQPGGQRRARTGWPTPRARSPCAFLYVDSLARAGRLDDAVLTFEKMQTYGNHLGLFSEEIDPADEQLGNSPQAFTHLSLINAAITLNHQLDERARHAGVWSA